MRKSLFVIIVLLLSIFNLQGKPMQMISGRIVNENNQPIEFATISLKGTKFNTVSDINGVFHLKAPMGKFTLSASYMGYKDFEKEIIVNHSNRHNIEISLKSDVNMLDEVLVTGSAIDIIKGSAFNTVAIDAKKLHNNSGEITSALSRLPGIKIREAGGVGSEMQFSLDGFTGKHVKIFIDGVPQCGGG